MSREEQQEVKQKCYSEAMRYMDNAKENLQKARKEDNFYQDRKYVRAACGIAYSGVLVAMDGYLTLKGFEKPKGRKRKSIEYYQERVGQIDRKLLNYLNSAYDTLHLSGYYDGNLNAKVVNAGFDVAYEIIEKIKPMQAA